MNHVVIIGFMGSGKTRVGKQLSKDLGLQFVDLDKLITKKMNLSAREIFEKFGEPYYRALETVALKQLIQDPERKVISLGAGVPLQEQNEKYLKELGTVVYLKGSLTTLKKRLADSKKDPMLDGEDRDDKIKKLLKQRDPVYQKFADIQVVTGEVPFEELIKEIEEKLSTYEKNSFIFLQKGGGDFMNHVVIIGFMGSGKTRVGKQLAKDLELPFVDLDRLITKKMNLSSREIFEKFGEPYYRALETLAVKQLIQDPERKVISLGAGLPLQEQNEKYLKQLGTIVYLKGSLSTLKKRLEGSRKDPLLDGDDRDEKIKKLLKQRDPVYDKFADIKVVTGEKPFEELIKEIEEKLH